MNVPDFPPQARVQSKSCRAAPAPTRAVSPLENFLSDWPDRHCLATMLFRIKQGKFLRQSKMDLAAEGHKYTGILS